MQQAAITKGTRVRTRISRRVGTVVHVSKDGIFVMVSWDDSNPGRAIQGWANPAAFDIIEEGN